MLISKKRSGYRPRPSPYRRRLAPRRAHGFGPEHATLISNPALGNVQGHIMAGRKQNSERGSTDSAGADAWRLTGALARLSERTRAAGASPPNGTCATPSSGGAGAVHPRCTRYAAPLVRPKLLRSGPTYTISVAACATVPRPLCSRPLFIGGRGLRSHDPGNSSPITSPDQQRSMPLWSWLTKDVGARRCEERRVVKSGGPQRPPEAKPRTKSQPPTLAFPVAMRSEQLDSSP